MWKENVLDELKAGELKFETVGEFLVEIKKEFRGGEEELVKAAELRKLEQGGKMIEEFVQEFKRAARGSGYEGRLLVEEFKRGMNGMIRRRLMEAKNQPSSIEQWYKRTMALDRNWRENKKEEEKLRGKKEQTGAVTDMATTLSMAEETSAFSAGNNRACFNRRSRENKCSSSERIRTRDRGFLKKGPLSNGSGQGEKLLCLWRVWVHGPSLQKSRKEKGSRWKKAGI